MNEDGAKKGRHALRRARKQQGFEFNPPRCTNCVHLKTPLYGRPETAWHDRKPYVPPSCGLGGFQVNPWSICDQWKGRDGEVLDTPALATKEQQP